MTQNEDLIRLGKHLDASIDWQALLEKWGPIFLQFALDWLSKKQEMGSVVDERAAFAHFCTDHAQKLAGK